MPRRARAAARFFAGHGPATAKDLAWWASLTLAEARAGIERAGERLRREEAGGRVLWSGPDRDVVRRSPVVHLVQGYDEMIMGYAETKGLLVRPDSSWTAATPPVGRLVILLDGRVGGFWRRTVGKDGVLVEAELLDDWSPAGREALEAEAARFGAFLGLSAQLAVTS